MYEYAKMLLEGYGHSKDKLKAIEYLKMSIDMEIKNPCIYMN